MDWIGMEYNGLEWNAFRKIHTAGGLYNNNIFLINPSIFMGLLELSELSPGEIPLSNHWFLIHSLMLLQTFQTATLLYIHIYTIQYFSMIVTPH